MAPENRVTEYYPAETGASYNADKALQDAAFKSLNMFSPRLGNMPRNSQTIELTGGAQRNVLHPIGGTLKDENKRLATENLNAAQDRMVRQ